jgi:hypothetical protein
MGMGIRATKRVTGGVWLASGARGRWPKPGTSWRAMKWR